MEDLTTCVGSDAQLAFRVLTPLPDFQTSKHYISEVEMRGERSSKIAPLFHGLVWMSSDVLSLYPKTLD